MIFSPTNPGFLAAVASVVRPPTVGYALDETSDGSGAVSAVASYGGVNLTDNNTVTSAAGKVYANARQFTRANSESLSASDAAIFSTGDIDFGVYCWAYFNSSGVTQMLVAKGSAGSAANAAVSEYILQRFSDDKVYFDMGPGSGTTFGEVGSAATVSASVWHWIAAWRNKAANTMNLKIDNGTTQSVAYSLGGCDNASAFRLGTDDGATRYLNGRMQQVMLTKGFFYTAAEMTAIYNNGNGLPFSSF